VCSYDAVSLFYLELYVKLSIYLSVSVVQVGVLCLERSRFTNSGENVSGLAGEAIMLCMEPLCVRMMQLAFFTLSFT
jgi:hypothetical protein